MSDFHYHQTQRSMSRAQRAYDNQTPPDDDTPTRECDQCGEEYEPEYIEGLREWDICEKCRKQLDEGKQD